MKSRIFSIVSAVLFTAGAVLYGFLLGDSLRMRLFRIVPSEDGYTLAAGAPTPGDVPYLAACLLLAVFLSVHLYAAVRPRFKTMLLASASAVTVLLFPLFTSVTLAEFTHFGITGIAALWKFVPFVLSAVCSLLAGRFTAESQ